MSNKLFPSFKDNPAAAMSSLVVVTLLLAVVPFFAGHFPGNPIVPGVILLEALAQTLAYGVLRGAPGQRVLLTGIEHGRFRQPVVPGQRVVFEVKPERTVMGVTQATGVVSVEGDVVAQATVKGFVGK